MNEARVATLAGLVGGRFTPEDCSSWPELYQAATELAGSGISYERASAALNVWARERAKAQPQPVEAIGVLDLGEPVKGSRPLPNGTYTVVLTGDEDYVTLRISDWRSKPGKQVVAFLNGPDNGLDFLGFGHVEAGALHVWGRFSTGYQRQQDAARILMGAETLGEYTTAYALRSGRCARCGRQLTVPASLHRGLGPECAKL